MNFPFEAGRNSVHYMMTQLCKSGFAHKLNRNFQTFQTLHFRSILRRNQYDPLTQMSHAHETNMLWIELNIDNNSDKNEESINSLCWQTTVCFSFLTETKFKI